MILGAVGHAQPGGPAAAVGAAGNPTLTTHFAIQAGKPHQLVIVDTQNRAVAVYNIDPDTGEIELASVRSIAWDLRMEEFNSIKQLPPKDIRAALQDAS